MLGVAMPTSSEEQFPLRGGLFCGPKVTTYCCVAGRFLNTGGLLRRAINEDMVKVGLITTV